MMFLKWYDGVKLLMSLKLAETNFLSKSEPRDCTYHIYIYLTTLNDTFSLQFITPTNGNLKSCNTTDPNS
ncbi:hypothetical protein QVD17_15327 [Tagetes erecta]|uniref:Uncharacterized protein n=1 Tax=Tagetes erecta TaxID=13708 RepID=A0AAD8KP08_TARER|nr:hypothetical protein QVD17_15327 [Tagetes erecta]